VSNLIGKSAIVISGINKGKAGKIVQHEDDWVVLVMPDGTRQGYRVNTLIIN
jgi:hypothetical protein